MQFWKGLVGKLEAHILKWKDSMADKAPCSSLGENWISTSCLHERATVNSAQVGTSSFSGCSKHNALLWQIYNMRAIIYKSVERTRVEVLFYYRPRIFSGREVCSIESIWRTMLAIPLHDQNVPRATIWLDKKPIYWVN